MSRTTALVDKRKNARATESTGSRERIHGVALTLFARYGYEGVSLQMIADEVGLHKSTLFHHYKNKLELVDEVLDSVLEAVLGCLRPILASEIALEPFYAGIDRLVDHFSDRPEAARLLVSLMSAPDDSELRSGVATERVLEFYVSLGTWFETARKKGVIRPLNIRQAIPNLIGIVLFYPAVAKDIPGIVGPEPYSTRAREIRKVELRKLLAGMLEP